MDSPRARKPTLRSGVWSDPGCLRDRSSHKCAAADSANAAPSGAPRRNATGAAAINANCASSAGRWNVRTPADPARLAMRCSSLACTVNIAADEWAADSAQSHQHHSGIVPVVESEAARLDAVRPAALANCRPTARCRFLTVIVTAAAVTAPAAAPNATRIPGGHRSASAPPAATKTATSTNVQRVAVADSACGCLHTHRCRASTTSGPRSRNIDIAATAAGTTDQCQDQATISAHTNGCASIE